MRIVFLIPILSVWLNVTTKAQHIVSVDTVCVNEPVTFSVSGGRQFTTYAWEFGTKSLTPIIAPAQPVPGTGRVGSGSTGMFDVAGGVTMVYDNGNYYAFVTSARNFSVQRLDFGADPNSTPIVVNLGNPGGAIRVLNNYPNMALIDIVKDGNLWYGFIADKEALVRLEFGTSLTNTPTATRMNFPAVMEFGMQLTVLKYGNEWVAFCGNTGDAWWGGSTLRSHYILRFDFGLSITNTPTPTILPNFNELSEPCYFSLVEDQGQWYMLVANMAGSRANTLARYSFGTDLKNNNPTLVNMGNPGGFDWPRSISTVKGCDTFYAVQVNERGTVNALDFNNSIVNTPTGISLGNIYGTGMGTHVFRPYWYNDTLWVVTACFSSLPTANVFRLPLLCIPSGNAVIKYYDTTATYTFNTPGVYDVTVYCDQADQRGAYAFCKRIVVLDLEQDFLGQDTTLCLGQEYTLSGPNISADSFVWSTGSRSRDITVNQSGTYWLHISGGICFSADTIELSFIPLSVSLGPDTSTCAGDSLVLEVEETYRAPAYLWSTGLIGSSIVVNRGGTYWVFVKDSIGCIGSDTVQVQLKRTPQVELGSDTTICSHIPLRIGDSIANASFLWNNGMRDAFIYVSTPGIYYLSMDLEGCVGYDSIVVSVIPTHVPDLGNERIICDGTTELLSSGGDGTQQYVWNTGDTTSTITAAQAGEYIVTVISGERCFASDTLLLTAARLPSVHLMNDTIVCEETPLEVRALSQGADSIWWSDGNVGEVIQIRYGGTYVASASNECGIVRDTINVRQIFCDIWLPNVFTPNGDGKNDVYRVLGNLSRLNHFSLSIFDRWGQRVFSTTDKYQGWDGTLNGSACMLGTYVYLLEYAIDGQPVVDKGSFHLIR